MTEYPELQQSIWDILWKTGLMEGSKATELADAIVEVVAKISKANIAILEELQHVGYDSMHKTYDYNMIAEAVFERLDRLTNRGRNE